MHVIFSTLPSRVFSNTFSCLTNLHVVQFWPKMLNFVHWIYTEASETRAQAYRTTSRYRHGPPTRGCRPCPSWGRQCTFVSNWNKFWIEYNLIVLREYSMYKFYILFMLHSICKHASSLKDLTMLKPCVKDHFYLP